MWEAVGETGRRFARPPSGHMPPAANRRSEEDSGMHIPRQRLFWAVGLGHFTNDTFVSMGPVLLAFLSVSALPMTNTQIGFAVSTGQMIGALSQPFFGLLADRSGG